jgi:energy-coupling factor transport system ATP-binding protein
MAQIVIDNASYSYDGVNRAIERVNLHIDAIQSVAISGPNGAGKSTLVKMIMGLLRPSEGSIRLFGEDISRVSTAQIARKVGFVFQNPRMQIFHRTVLSEITFAPRRSGIPVEEIPALVTKALIATGLAGKEESHPYDLNPAERRLLAIASALAMDPQILILDEPSAGMDHASLDQVIGVIEMCQAEGKTVIMVTHDIDLAARCTNRLVVIHRGKIVADGDIHQLFTQSELVGSELLEATAIHQLARACNLPGSLLTVKEMVNYLVAQKGMEDGI